MSVVRRGGAMPSSVRHAPVRPGAPARAGKRRDMRSRCARSRSRGSGRMCKWGGEEEGEGEGMEEEEQEEGEEEYM